MGLWIKNEDGSIEKAAGGGGGGGPHDHDDYLPLTGGTLTGELQVDGTTKTNGLNALAQGIASPTNPNIVFGDGGANAQTGIYRNSTGKIQFACEGEQVVRFSLPTTFIYNDLQVDGKVQSSGGFETAPGVSLAGTKSGLWGGDGGIAIVVNQERKLDCKPDRVVSLENFAAEKDAEVGGVLRANGSVTIPNAALRMEHTGGGDRDINNAANLYITPTGWVYRSVSTRGGAFAPSKLARNSDVLERAETATLPPDIETDDDGNQTNTAEVEGHDTVELFDVVTALLAKVKQLSARIEELEGN